MIYKQLLLALAPVAAVNTAIRYRYRYRLSNQPMKLSATTLHPHHPQQQQQQAMMAMGRRSVAGLPLFFWMRLFSSQSKLNDPKIFDGLKEHSTEDEVVALE